MTGGQGVASSSLVTPTLNFRELH